MSEIEALVICSNQVKYVKCCINIVDSPNEGIRNYEKNHQYSNTHLEKKKKKRKERRNLTEQDDAFTPEKNLPILKVQSLVLLKLLINQK